MTSSFGAQAADGACQPGEGVTVVVDFADLGGGVVVRCAVGNLTSGFDALTAAGFSITQVQSNPAFLCRIDGRPTTDTEDCVAIPPADAYWSYWWADLGGSWRASQVGAGSAIQSDVEGWAFASGSTVAPGYVIPPTPTTTTTTTTTTSTTTTTTSSTTTSSLTTSTTLPTTTSTTIPTTTTTSSTTSTTTSLPPSTTTEVPPTTAATVTTLGASEEEGRGGLAGPLLATTLIVGVGAAGFVISRRRLDGSEGP